MFKFKEMAIIEEALIAYLKDSESSLAFYTEHYPNENTQTLQSNIDIARKLIEKINNLTID